MESILPIDLIRLILDCIKCTSITTLRQVARTCKYLNSILQHDIVVLQGVYCELYSKLECTFTMILNDNPKVSYMNELVLDGLFTANKLRKYILRGNLREMAILCYALAISDNVELMKLVPRKYLHCD